jgi:DNA-binding transcriptional LysR family regulator
VPGGGGVRPPGGPGTGDRWELLRALGTVAGDPAATPLVSREEGSGTREVLPAAVYAALGRRVTLPGALALSTTSAVRSAVLAGAGPAVLSELTLTEDITARRLARIRVAGVDLHRALRAIWAGACRPPGRPATCCPR